MEQQTAVEWFAKQAENILIDFAKNNSPFQLELCLHALNDLEVQAKEMEKQQHKYTWYDSTINYHISFEQYYNKKKEVYE